MQESNDTPTPPKYNAPGGASRGGGGGGGGYYEQVRGLVECTIPLDAGSDFCAFRCFNSCPKNRYRYGVVVPYFRGEVTNVNNRGISGPALLGKLSKQL